MREFRRFSLVSLLALLVGASAEAQVPYGNGSPGTGGNVPRLTSNQAFMGNANFSYSVSNGLGGASALLGLSLGKSSFFVGTTEILLNLGQLIILVPLGLTGPNGTPGAGMASLCGSSPAAGTCTHSSVPFSHSCTTGKYTVAPGWNASVKRAWNTNSS